MKLEIEEPPKIVLKGTPKEIGLGHGRQLRTQIHRQLAIYEEMFEYTAKMPWEQVRALAEEFRASLETKTPDLYAEMQGIAEGAERDLLDIVALNCRSEISFGSFEDGCTSLSWKKRADARVLAQNWDWTHMVKENLALMAIEQVGKPKIYMVTEAGIVGKIGYNSAGVGTCLNAIKAHPCVSSKLPIHIALRVCLESTSVEDALQRMAALGGVASCQHILIADAQSSLGLELSPLGDVHLKEDQYGIVTHTNHLLENRFVSEPPSWAPGSEARLDRVRELSHELVEAGVKGNGITPALLRDAVFSDMLNAPRSICSQPEPERHRTVRSETLFNIVMNLDLNDLRAEVVVGQPGSGMETAVLKMPW
ncbi:hypothetical protein FE257_012498 [Aspergillus nanangensis]|uniref:Peptidase C45 hydrolase domain-containing protein n=1 Tax=Aspergillus nanangensis TaxID=2582783 RepID=A0AAD4CWN1_ASPNN|nr:hypothetical protein FE257_012498 [Aspergillus nanangensis]